MVYWRVKNTKTVYRPLAHRLNVLISTVPILNRISPHCTSSPSATDSCSGVCSGRSLTSQRQQSRRDARSMIQRRDHLYCHLLCLAFILSRSRYLFWCARGHGRVTGATFILYLIARRSLAERRGETCATSDNRMRRTGPETRLGSDAMWGDYRATRRSMPLRAARDCTDPLLGYGTGERLFEYLRSQSSTREIHKINKRPQGGGCERRGDKTSLCLSCQLIRVKFVSECKPTETLSTLFEKALCV